MHCNCVCAKSRGRLRASVRKSLKCLKRCAFQCIVSLKRGFCEKQKKSEIRLKSELSHLCKSQIWRLGRCARSLGEQRVFKAHLKRLEMLPVPKRRKMQLYQCFIIDHINSSRADAYSEQKNSMVGYQDLLCVVYRKCSSWAFSRAFRTQHIYSGLNLSPTTFGLVASPE